MSTPHTCSYIAKTTYIVRLSTTKSLNCSLILFYMKVILCIWCYWPSQGLLSYIYIYIYFFFLISKNVIYTNGYFAWKNIEQTQKIQEEENWKKKKKNFKQQINYKRERELRKEGRESLVVSPHAQDQSKRAPLKEAIIWTPELSKSSKVLRFCSFQIHHRMHNIYIYIYSLNYSGMIKV